MVKPMKLFSIHLKATAIAALVTCFAALSAAAQEEDFERVSFGGELTYQIFQLVKSGGLHAKNIFYGDKRQVNRSWHHRPSGEIKVTIKPSVPLTFKLGYRAGLNGVGSGLAEANVSFAKPKFSFKGGIFKYKYNEDARNLGEYLIWSGVYMGYVFSSRDWGNYVGLMGHVDLHPNWSQDLLITTDMRQKPYFDVSLTYITDLKLANEIFEIGAGISFDRFISPNPEITTLPAHLDTIWNNSLDPTILRIDTVAEYSHRGIKVMARQTFDIRKLIGSPSIFGEQDLKLYAEAVILGLKSYPVYFDNLSERIPVMVGLNFPTFGLLDYLSIEAEYYTSPHNNTPPTKPDEMRPYEEPYGSEDDLKWSISAKRSLGDFVAIYARVANDHLRFENASGGTESWERMSAPDHWYWTAKATVEF